MKKITITVFMLLCLLMAITTGYSQNIFSGKHDAAKPRSWTPLMEAAMMGKLAVVKFLVAKGADVNARHENGNTPLLMAAEGEKLDVIEFLKQHGAKE